MKKPTIAVLMVEIEALRKRIAELEARPPFVIHNHPAPLPLHQQYPGLPLGAPFPGWRVGDVWCGAAVAVADAAALPWSGPRNPDGSCAPLGTATLTTAYGVGTGG